MELRKKEMRNKISTKREGNKGRGKRKENEN